MGYKVYYDEMWEIIDSIKTLKENWSAEFGQINSSVEELKTSSFIKGAGSDNIKCYMNEIHSNLIDRIEKMLLLLYGSVENYRGGYQESVDGGDGSDYGIRYTTMVQDELEYNGEVSRNIDSLIGLNSSIRWEVNSVRNSISDLIWLSEPSYADYIESALNIAKNIATTLNDKVLIHEGSQTNSINEVQVAIEELRNIINHQLGISRIPMASYVSNDWSTMCNSERLETATESIINTLNSTEFQEAYDRSIANTFDRQALIDKEEREKKAKAIKWAVTGLCVVASVAVTVLTAGAAAPLVLGAVGAATGAITSGTDFLLDEYVEDGDLKSVDWSGFGKTVLISSATGFVTGYLGGTLSAGSTAGQTFGQKIGQSFVTSMTGEVTEHTISTAWDVTEGIAKGDIKDINGVLEEIESETKEMAGDIVKDGISCVVDTALGDLIDLGEDKLFDDVKDGIGKSMGKVVYSSITDVAKDIAGDPTKNLFNEGVDAISEGRAYDIDNVTDKFKESVKLENIGDKLANRALENIGKEAGDKMVDKDKKLKAQMKKEAGKDNKVDMIQFEDGTIVLEKDYEMAKYNAENYTELDKELGYKRNKNAREILGVKTTQGATKIQVDYDKIQKADYKGKAKVNKYVINNEPKTK